MSVKVPSERLLRLKRRMLRWQLTMGLGFVSLILGMWTSFSVVSRFQPKLASLPPLVGMVVPALFAHFWVFAALPLIAFLLARVVDVAPWPTAVGAALTGELFLGAISFVSAGLDALRPEWPWTFFHAVSVGGGLWLTARAIHRGRAQATQADARAQATAQARQEEYARFLQDAERLPTRAKNEPRGADGEGDS